MVRITGRCLFAFATTLLCFVACDSEQHESLEMLREGDDDTTDETSSGEESIPTGDPFGPCFSNDAHTYHWCDATPFPYTVMCAVPQEDGKPHATVCVERRLEDECPAFQLLSIGGGLFQSYAVEQDFWNGCSLVCDAAVDCPLGMICASEICAWETF